jgi:hypothetical protein
MSLKSAAQTFATLLRTLHPRMTPEIEDELRRAVAEFEKVDIALRAERDMWKERWEAEHLDHQATIKQLDEILGR